MAIFFDKHYFYDRQEFGKYIQQNVLDLAANQFELCCKREEELFYSCNSGDFKNFCGLPSGEGEFIPTLKAIKECLVLSSNFPFYLNNYCSCENIFILDGTQRIEVFHGQTRGYYVAPFYLNSVRESNATISFILNYDIRNAIPQKLAPSLEFYSEDKLVHSYLMSDNSHIDLSQKGKKSISFRIPTIDIFTQGAGYYVIKFGISEFAKVEFPRCGLPINGGIYSFSELREFCDNLNGSPTYELLSFYNILKRGELATWLQDNEEEGKYKEEIDESYRKIKAEHPFRINDINSVLEIVSKRTISFSLYDYISIEIVNAKLFDSESIIRAVADHNHFIKWKSNSRGKIEIHIEPEEDFVDVADVLDWNLEFKIGFCVGDKHLQGKPISFNLSDLKDKGKHFDFYFECEDFSGQHMGTYPLSIVSGKERIKTDYSFSITGEIIDLKLPGGIPFPMVGIMYGEGNFYIAQTPITQEQFQVIAKNADSIYGDIKTALLKSVNTHEGKNYPATHLTYHDCLDIVDYLEDVFNHSFYIPNYKLLYVALCNGFRDESIKNNKLKKHEHILEVRNNHRTKLEVFDLLNNIYLHTTDTISHLFRPDERICFGSTYFEISDDPKRKFCEEGRDDYSLFGFCPIAFNLVQPEEDSDTNEKDDSHTIDSGSSSTDSSGMDDYVIPIYLSI